MYSSVIRTAVEPRLHLISSIDGFTRHFGPHKNGCLKAFKQLERYVKEDSSLVKLFYSGGWERNSPAKKV